MANTTANNLKRNIMETLTLVWKVICKSFIVNPIIAQIPLESAPTNRALSQHQAVLLNDRVDKCIQNGPRCMKYIDFLVYHNALTTTDDISGLGSTTVSEYVYNKYLKDNLDNSKAINWSYLAQDQHKLSKQIILSELGVNCSHELCISRNFKVNDFTNSDSSGSIDPVHYYEKFPIAYVDVKYNLESDLHFGESTREGECVCRYSNSFDEAHILKEFANISTTTTTPYSATIKAAKEKLGYGAEYRVYIKLTQTADNIKIVLKSGTTNKITFVNMQRLSIGEYVFKFVYDKSYDSKALSIEISSDSGPIKISSMVIYGAMTSMAMFISTELEHLSNINSYGNLSGNAYYTKPRNSAITCKSISISLITKATNNVYVQTRLLYPENAGPLIHMPVT